MFEDSLFASTARPSGQRGKAAVLSFAVQMLGIGLLVLVPLLYTNALPISALKNYVEIPLPPGRPANRPPAQTQRPSQPVSSNIQQGVLVLPIRFPDKPAQLDEHPEDVSSGPEGPYVVGSPNGLGDPNSVINSVVASNMRAVVPPPVHSSIKAPAPVSGGVIEGLLIRRINPEYPYIAKISHTQGTVILHAIIGRDGTIQNLQAVSGPPLLVAAAVNAVKQWRYRPYLLNHEPVEVDTQITVNFTLN
jgi:periplasmic protein TonB